MGRTGALKHTHRYHKTRPNTRRNEPVWACSLPGCSHFIPLNTTVEGRKSLCWNCGEELIMTENEMAVDKPECPSCALASSGMDLDALAALLKEKGL